MKYNANNQSNETFKQSQQNSRSWAFQSKIPALISISSVPKQALKEKQIIKSLRHSDVVSIYTEEQISPERNASQIYAYPFQEIKGVYYTRSPQESVENVEKEQTFIKTLTKTNNQLFKPLRYSQQQQHNEKMSLREHSQMFQLQNCKAIQLYNQVVSKEHLTAHSYQSFSFDWMPTKTSSELLANLMTNSTRLKLYIHYLIKEIDLNQRNKLLNQLHQESIKEYNPTLKQTYTHILCLISKLLKKQDKQTVSPQKMGKSSFAQKSSNSKRTQSQAPIEVSLYENGISLNLNPKLNKLKSQNNVKIRELKHKIYEQEQKMQNLKKVYEQIIQNYALSIENFTSPQQQPQPKDILLPFVNVVVPLKESRVFLQVQQQPEQNMIRNKNHTFGMMKSIRSSKNYN